MTSFLSINEVDERPGLLPGQAVADTILAFHRTVLPSSARTIEVVQRYEFEHSHENAEHNEAGAEYSLAA